MANQVPGDARDHSAPSEKRPRKFGSRGVLPKVGVMLLALLIGAAALWDAKWMQTFRDPPPISAEPTIKLLLSPGQQLPWATDTDYQVKETFRRCQNPVTVELDALVNGTNTAVGGPTPTPQGYAHGELDDPLRLSGRIELLENTENIEPSPPFLLPPHEFTQSSRDRQLFGAPLPAWYPSAVQWSMSRLTARAPLVELRFQANWVLPRGPGSCFVLFPALQAEGAEPPAG